MQTKNYTDSKILELFHLFSNEDDIYSLNIHEKLFKPASCLGFGVFSLLHSINVDINDLSRVVHTRCRQTT